MNDDHEVPRAVLTDDGNLLVHRNSDIPEYAEGQRWLIAGMFPGEEPGEATIIEVRDLSHHGVEGALLDVTYTDGTMRLLPDALLIKKLD